MSEEELYKLLNIPYKPWIELTDEEIQLFEKNNNYIKQLQQKNKQLKDILIKINKIIESSYRNVGFNDNHYEYNLTEKDIEEIYEMIPEEIIEGDE